MVNCFFSHFYQVCISKRFFHSRSSHFTFGSDCTVLPERFMIVSTLYEAHSNRCHCQGRECHVTLPSPLVTRLKSRACPVISVCEFTKSCWKWGKGGCLCGVFASDFTPFELLRLAHGQRKRISRIASWSGFSFRPASKCIAHIPTTSLILQKVRPKDFPFPHTKSRRWGKLGFEEGEENESFWQHVHLYCKNKFDVLKTMYCVHAHHASRVNVQVCVPNEPGSSCLFHSHPSFPIQTRSLIFFSVLSLSLSLSLSLLPRRLAKSYALRRQAQTAPTAAVSVSTASQPSRAAENIAHRRPNLPSHTRATFPATNRQAD